MRSEEYWAKRMETLNEAELKKGEDYIKTQNAEYDKAMARIKRETESWYARLAENNGISMAEARKLLKNNELKEFRWTVDDYIKAGRENAVDQRWMKELENASAKAHITRLEELQTKIRQEVELLTARRVKGTTEVLGDVYKSGYYKGIHEVQRGIGEGIPFARLDTRQIDKVLAKPWTPDGRNFSARIWADRDKLLSELQTVLTQDLIRGEASDKVITDFANRMGVSKRAAERLILTESAYFSGQSRLDGYRSQGIKKYKFVATLDSRTSEECRHMDGEVIPVSEAKAGVNYPPLHAYCYDDLTEVYTSRGWVLFSELQGDETFYSIDPESLLPDWQPAINIIAYHYNGQMRSFRNARFDLLVTPNHRMLVQNMDSKNKARKWKLREARALSGQGKNRFLCGMNWNGADVDGVLLGGKLVPTKTYCKFMAYWLADGSSTPDRSSYNIKIAQQNNDWMFDELKDFPFKIYKGKESLSIRDKQLGEELARFGLCHEKYVPDIIKQMSPEMIRAFLIAYSKTDGTTRKGKLWKGHQFEDSITFFSTSKRMADDLGELIMKAGGRPSFRLENMAGREIEFRNGVYTINHNLWIVSWNKQIHSWTNNMDVKDVSYDGMVYCVELAKHHTLLVRRNGKIAWSGNCRSTTIPFFDDDTGDNKAPEPGERAARGKDGKTYSVPADMTYKEWEAEHAPKGAAKPPVVQEPAPVTPPAVKTVPEMPEPDFEEIDATGSAEPGIPVPPKLTKTEEAAVSRYVGGESYVLNEKLREGKPLNSDEMKWVEQLDNALLKLPRFTGDLTRSLFFASQLDADEAMKDIQPGAVLQYPQYMSMSAASALYNPKGQVHYYILGAAAGADIRAYNQSELEVLYGRDFPFEVVDVEIINGVYHVLIRELRK